MVESQPMPMCDPEALLSCDTARSNSSTSSDTASSSPLSDASSASDADGASSDVSARLREPYPVGFTATAMRHEPPDPFGHDYDTATPGGHPDRKHMSKENYCFTRPYILPGRTFMDETQTLTITATIRVGQSCGPQIVVVNNNLVAKIYDPLHYEEIGEYGYPEDIVWLADEAYAREAAAYNHIWKSGKATDLVPSFHGTWIMNVESVLTRNDDLVRCTRPVRLILMEHLQGQCMQSLDAQSLSETVRSSILKECLDAEMRLFHAGVGHNDFCPRNIILIGRDYNTPNLQVKIIDFGLATIYDHPQYTYIVCSQARNSHEEADPATLESPLKRHFGQLREFSHLGWCLGSDDWAEENWIWEHYRNDTRYRTVYWDPKQPEEDPEYVVTKEILEDVSN